MPIFEVKRRVDAYVDYYAKVEAETPAAAVKAACNTDEALTWEKGDTQEFDAGVYIALDANGDEIAETETSRRMI